MFASVSWGFFTGFARLDIILYGSITGFGMMGGGLIGLVRTLKSLHDARD